MNGHKKWINGGFKIIVYVASIAVIAVLTYANVQNNIKAISKECDRNDLQDQQIHIAEVNRKEIQTKQEVMHEDIKETNRKLDELNRHIMDLLKSK